MMLPRHCLLLLWISSTIAWSPTSIPDSPYFKRSSRSSDRRRRGYSDLSSKVSKILSASLSSVFRPGDGAISHSTSKRANFPSCSTNRRPVKFGHDCIFCTKEKIHGKKVFSANINSGRRRRLLSKIILQILGCFVMTIIMSPGKKAAWAAASSTATIAATSGTAAATNSALSTFARYLFYGCDVLLLSSFLATGRLSVPVLLQGKNKEKAKQKETPLLNRYGVDLTQQAREQRLDPIRGRDVEIQSCLRTLLRRRKNNPCLIGEPGVGKTAIAEGLAQLLVENTNVPPILQDYRLVQVEMAKVLSGAEFRGVFEKRLTSLLTEVEGTKTILFIDELHTLVGTGASSTESSLDAAQILKPALARGGLKLLGATTNKEYKRYIESDGALERRFQTISVEEPSLQDTQSVLQSLQANYELHHSVTYTKEALEAAAALSQRYIPDRFLPDKAIDVIDEAGALVQLQHMSSMSDDVTDTLDTKPLVTEHHICQVLSQWTQIPLGQMQESELSRLSKLESLLEDRIKGQPTALSSVSRAIRRARCGLRDPTRPVASLLLSGPTGTGKTELAKTVASVCSLHMVRIDLSEYMEKESVSRLTGPPPGYVGYDQGGQLTEAVRRNPHSVVLFDEMEKAHPDVLNTLLQVLDDGMLTDGQGRTVSFCNTIIIFTSNVGSKHIIMDHHDRKNNYQDGTASLTSIVQQELRHYLKPEFLNRLDEVVPFAPLGSKELSEILNTMIAETLQRARQEHDLVITVHPSVQQEILNEGLQQNHFGARPLRRGVQFWIEDVVSQAVVKGMKGHHLTLDYVNGDVMVSNSEATLRFSVQRAVS